MSARTAIFLLTALTLLVIALSTGVTVYYLLVAMLGMMALLGLESALLTLYTLQISAVAQRRRAVRGDSVAIRLTLRRRTLLPVGLIELEVSSPDGGDVGHIAVSVAPIRGREYRYTIRCAHRGVYEVGVSRVRVTDVFGLFSFSRKVRGNAARVEVAPRTETLPPMNIRPGDIGPQGRVRMTEDLASPSGVRDWQEGDGLKKVHWKLTARKRELMVRTFEESARPDLLILMDCAPVNSMTSHVRFIEDALCEAAASAALAQLTAGYTVRMPLASASPTELAGQQPGEIGSFLNALTWLKFDSPYHFEQVIALEMRRLQRTGAVILISTRMNAALADLAMRINQLGVQVQYVCVSETVHKDHEALEKRMELMNIPVRRVNPWDKRMN